MREIKFRFWVEKAKRMADWETTKIECDRLSLLSFEGFIPMQYTGFKDKNGIDIYEGDVIKALTLFGDSEIKGTIIFERGMWLAKEIHPKYSETEYLNELTKGDNRSVVIGNIHQNPELLK